MAIKLDKDIAKCLRLYLERFGWTVESRPLEADGSMIARQVFKIACAEPQAFIYLCQDGWDDDYVKLSACFYSNGDNVLERISARLSLTGGSVAMRTAVDVFCRDIQREIDATPARAMHKQGMAMSRSV